MMHRMKGFQVTESVDGWEFVSIESDRLQDYLEFFNGLDRKRFGIHLSKIHGYKLAHLEFLESVPGLRALYLQDTVEDWSGVERLGELEWLLVPAGKTPLNLEKLPNLTALRGEWSECLKNVADLTRLELLAWRKFKSKTRNLEELGALKRLKSIELVQSNIKTLKGIEGLAFLEELKLYRNRDLVDISGVTALADSLSVLRIENSKKIENVEVVSRLENLRDLSLSDCGAIRSLEFVTVLNKLRMISLVGTSVLDGRVDMLLDLPELRHAGIDDKRHYSKSYATLNKELRERS